MSTSGSRDLNTTAAWVNEYGQLMADYEVRIIEDHHWDEEREAMALLGFTVHGFGMNGIQAVSCATCGVMYAPEVMRHLRAHRRLCGWDNGSPAVASQVGDPEQ